MEVQTPGKEEELDCSSQDEEVTEDLEIDVSFTIIDYNLTDADSIVSFSTQFNLFQTSITKSVSSSQFSIALIRYE